MIKRIGMWGGGCYSAQHAQGVKALEIVIYKALIANLLYFNILHVKTYNESKRVNRFMSGACGIHIENLIILFETLINIK